MKKACILTFFLLSSLLVNLTLVNLTLVNPTVNPAFAPVGDVFDATCRVHSNGGIGSGVVFKDNKTHFWIMTAGHVVLDKEGKKYNIDNVYVDFFHNGYQSHKIKAEIIFSSYKPIYDEQGQHLESSTNDLAIIKIKKIDLKKYPHPKPIPLAKKDYDPKAKDVIVFCGGSAWSTVWRGHIIREFEGGFSFMPIPIQGQSGSGVFDKKGEKIIGILIMGNDSEATAISHTKIYQLKNE